MITSGQSNLTTCRIAAACGQFNGIRQVVPMCTPHMLPWAFQCLNPNGISIASAIFAQLAAERM